MWRALLAMLLIGCGSKGPAAEEPGRVGCEGWAPAARDPGVGGEVTVIGDGLAGKKLVRVGVDGNRAIPDPLVLAVTELKPGARVSRAAIADDLKRIWALEAFADVAARLTPARRGVALDWIVIERPRVGRVVVDGGHAPRRVLAMRGGVHDPVRVSRVAEAVRLQLEHQGHLRARVKTGARRAGDRIDLCVAVRPGPRFLVGRVEFPGSGRVAADELRRQLHTRDGHINAPGGVYRADLLAADQPYLLALYYERGMIDARVGEPKVTTDGRRLVISIPVHEGPVYRLGKLAVSGAPAAERARLLGSLAPGQPFARSRVAEAETRMRDWLQARGRPDQVQPITAVDAARRTIDITFELGGG